MIDSEYFYKNLHEGSLTNLKQSNPFIKPLNNAYKSRLDLLKEKFRNNVFVGNYKKLNVYLTFSYILIKYFKECWKTKKSECLRF